MDKTAAIYESLRKNFTAIFIASATTAVGFLSLNYSDAPRLQYLGNLTAFGVFAAWIRVITFVPAFLCFMPLKPAAESKTGLFEQSGRQAFNLFQQTVENPARLGHSWVQNFPMRRSPRKGWPNLPINGSNPKPAAAPNMT
jgi:predicted RND superfamily exporter protein